MLTRHPDYYPHFHCLGESCPDTCCRDWDIVLDDETIADYQMAPSPLAQRLQASLTTDQDGDICFRLDAHGFCTMLTKDGLCAIQQEWGESHLCGHCGAYPRFTEEYGSLTETALAISCPEAARLLLECGVFHVEEEDDGQPDAPFPGIPPRLLTGLETSRKKVLALVSQDHFPLWARIQGMLYLAHTLQDHVETQDYPAMVNLNVTPCAPSASVSCKAFVQSLCRFFATLEPLRTLWTQRLEACRKTLEGLTEAEYQALCRRFQAQVPQWQQHLANLTGYFIFRHWHKTVNDDQLYPRAAFIASSIVLLYHLFLVQWEQDQILTLDDEISICCAFSREVEHMEENLDQAMEACSTLSPTSIPFPHL